MWDAKGCLSHRLASCVGPVWVAVFKPSELYYPHAIHENLRLRDDEATYQMSQMVEKEVP